MGLEEEIRLMGLETQVFLINTWYVAAWDHELADGKLLAHGTSTLMILAAA